ncbi:MAG TPA: GTP-binding protein [Chloroflexota bacterium]|nr:GTP-binding protein [Chloroflexota bacterium]
MPYVNLGILAHVDAGKTSLTERLALTRGEGVLEYAFDRYEPVRGTIPTRPRSDHNPLNRKEYLLHVLRRV